MLTATEESQGGPLLLRAARLSKIAQGAQPGYHGAKLRRGLRRRRPETAVGVLERCHVADGRIPFVARERSRPRAGERNDEGQRGSDRREEEPFHKRDLDVVSMSRRPGSVS